MRKVVDKLICDEKKKSYEQALCMQSLYEVGRNKTKGTRKHPLKY